MAVENAYEKLPKRYTAEEYRQLVIAQRKFELGVYDFKAYHIHLSMLVYNTD